MTPPSSNAIDALAARLIDAGYEAWGRSGEGENSYVDTINQGFDVVEGFRLIVAAAYSSKSPDFAKQWWQEQGDVYFLIMQGALPVLEKDTSLPEDARAIVAKLRAFDTWLTEERNAFEHAQAIAFDAEFSQRRSDR